MIQEYCEVAMAHNETKILKQEKINKTCICDLHRF